MPDRPHGFPDLADADMEEVIREIHADDVARARGLIDAAIAAADEQWIPRNAQAEALLGALREMTRHQPPERHFDA